MEVTYKQKTKQIARHKILKKAIELLTQERSSLCCVSNNYVRNVYEYFIGLEESIERDEAKKIDMSYIRMWENIHTQCLGNKRVEEITVCYLAGPEPENDFLELINLGVLPNNIWAFESEKNIYMQALKTFDSTDYFQPKLIKTSIERFFENTPKTFDIVYIDACSPLVSEQHALRCIASMFKFHRLTSPGILISNFAEIDPTNSLLLEEHYSMISKYNIIKNYPECILMRENDRIYFKENYDETYTLVKSDFEKYYGDFVTAMICDIGAITIPTMRFVNSTYLSYLTDTKPLRNKQYCFSDINTIKNNTLFKFLAVNNFLESQYVEDNGINRINKLVQEISANWNGYTLLQCFQKLYEMREQDIGIRSEMKEVFQYFESTDNIYQFLDRPTKKLFLDAIINQLACPMHYCTDKIVRLTYTAKQTQMYMDLIPFDECRYIYEWLPSIDQIKNAFTNKSWQYIFRFSLDGLVKQRINYNNEFFFQGSVISHKVHPFEAKTISKRQKINEGGF